MMESNRFWFLVAIVLLVATLTPIGFMSTIGEQVVIQAMSRVLQWIGEIVSAGWLIFGIGLAVLAVTKFKPSHHQGEDG